MTGWRVASVRSAFSGCHHAIAANRRTASRDAGAGAGDDCLERSPRFMAPRTTRPLKTVSAEWHPDWEKESKSRTTRPLLTWGVFMQQRQPLEPEQRLLASLVAGHTAVKVPPDWLDCLLVTPMDDGRMGSLRLHSPPFQIDERTPGVAVSELGFIDADGVDVLATLYVNSHGVPVEVGVWKVDFSPVQMIPRVLPRSRPVAAK